MEKKRIMGVLLPLESYVAQRHSAVVAAQFAAMVGRISEVSLEDELDAPLNAWLRIQEAVKVMDLYGDKHVREIVERSIRNEQQFVTVERFMAARPDLFLIHNK